MESKIIPAEYDHIPWIAEHIREADRREMWNYAMLKPLAALARSLSVSEIAYTGFIDDEPVCMLGVARSGILSNVGRPWLIGTTKIEKHQILFLRKCKPVIEEMKALFPVMENYIAPDNTKAIRWLKWLKFEFDKEPVSIGPLNKKFTRFRMVTE